MNESELIHRVCHWLRTEYDEHGRCEQCPLKVESPYGPGTQACVLRAQEVIEIVRGTAQT